MKGAERRMKRTELVDVFLGSGAINLPEPQGIAAKWRFIKGLAGNTTPAAALPFGKITACAYSGGYSAGYGFIGINCGEPLRRIMEPGTIRGFTHIHNSGTGYIDTFYNYALTAPFYGDNPRDAFAPDSMKDETAKPGYYAVTMRNRDIRAELTVTRRAAHHRYAFSRPGGAVAVDFTSNGLLEERTRAEARSLICEPCGTDAARCTVTLYGLRLYFFVRVPGAAVRIWQKGCWFTNLPEGDVRLLMGVSPKSFAFACAGEAELDTPFAALVQAAEDEWEEALSRINVEADTPRDERLFYSNLYHSLIKPSDWNGESFLYDDEDACVLDFATLWDQYKTQMPLLFTLYPDISRKIVATIIAYARARERLPHTLMLDNRPADSDDKQAKLLAAYVLLDAWYRGIAMDVTQASLQIKRDLLNESRYTDYKTNGVCGHIAHTIDLADACGAAAEFARAAGDTEFANEAERLSVLWTRAFDEETGLLRADSAFYEGSHWNYSFRLMRDMETRLKIAGGPERYGELLDRFFGFLPQEDGSVPPFEGFNNETDMETPYAYFYSDRPERLCRVISDGMRSMFCEGRGGLPGNNDSGGLSSLYLWNAMGIFPVSGQDLMLIGTPLLRRAELHLSNGCTFVIRRKNEGIFVTKALLNGVPLEKLCFSVREMMRGGELVLECAAVSDNDGR